MIPLTQENVNQIQAGTILYDSSTSSYYIVRENKGYGIIILNRGSSINGISTNISFVTGDIKRNTEEFYKENCWLFEPPAPLPL